MTTLSTSQLELNDTNSSPDSYLTDDSSSENAISPIDLAKWCNEYLHIDNFKDYCPNGLQVDAAQPIRHIVTGVTACEALIDQAIELKADAILVHHGYFWKGEDPELVGMKGRRVRKLMQHGISLLAYHLPLDAHPKLGNNAILARDLGLKIIGALYPEESHPVGNITTCEPITAQQLQSKLATLLGREPLWIAGYSQATAKPLQKIALCTGGAQDMIDQAAKMGCDAYISGEISERTTHSARELQVDYFACGHHATERGGIDALGQLVETELGIKTTFIDIDNPA